MAVRTDMRVLLVNAPFGLVEYPHMGCSLLKATCADARIPCDVLYASIEFARIIGFKNYYALECLSSPLLLPERMFAEELFPGIPSLDRYFDDCVARFRSTIATVFKGRGDTGAQREQLRAVVAHAHRYVDEMTSRPELARYRVIGFSSSYGQHVASLALAKRIKERYPDAVICFGGANCEGVMGKQLVQSFPFVDYAFSGDGDMSFATFVAALRDGQPIDVRGVYHRGRPLDMTRQEPPLLRHDLDELPYPDFTDYFTAFAKAPEGKPFERAIPIEGSRGCWWGAKHHCTFCGLNAQGMVYRRKSPQRFVDELEYLVTRYAKTRVMACDNMLDMSYMKTVVPMLTEHRAHDVLFFETKSNLSRRELVALHAAGISEIQAGVESLSTHVLQLIDKGVTGLQNVQLLKWAEEVGVTVVWTILAGIPGERPEDYEEMAALMAKIPHLQPARGFNRVTIDRFSPYFQWPERYGIRIQPASAYAYVFALPAEELANLAFWYSYECENGSTATTLEAPPYARRALQARAIWESVYGRVRFAYEVATDGAVVLEDTRAVAPAQHVRLSPLESAVFLAADGVSTARSVHRALAGSWDCSIEAAAAALADLEARMIVHREGDHYLALASRSRAEKAAARIVPDSNRVAKRRRLERAAAAAAEEPARVT